MLIIGHRGAKGLAPENTTASLEAALKHKVDVIEFDVRTSKDLVPVLHHNSDIGIKGPDLDIMKTDFKDLRAAKPDLMTLDEALRYLKNRLPVVVEIKPAANTQPIIECIRSRMRNEWDTHNIWISSFSKRVLTDIHRELPEVRLIINEQWSALRTTRRARKFGTSYITMNQRWLWPGLIRLLSRRGYKLSAYTINNPSRAEKWSKAGLYAVVTDYPDKF